MIILKSAVAAAAAAFMLAGCATGDTDGTGSEQGVTEPTVSPTAPALLDFDISTLLTLDQVTSAWGGTVEQPIVYEDGTIVRYYADGRDDQYVEVLLEDTTRSDFDDILIEITGLSDTPNLGDAAKWSEDDSQLYCYGQGHMMQVTVADETRGNDVRLTCARQLAALVLDALALQE